MEHRSRQTKAPRHALRRQLGKLGATGVAQTEQFGGLVEGLTSGVIDRLTQQHIVTHPAHPHQLGVSARHQQRNKGKLRRIGRQQRRQQVTFEMMHGQSGDAPRQREGLSHTRAHKQGAGQARP